MNLKEVLTKIKTEAGEAWEKIKQNETLKTVKEGASEIYHKVTESETVKNIKEKTGDVYDKVKSSVGDNINNLSNKINKTENKQKLVDAFAKACEDGSLSSEDMAEINTMRTLLDISDEEMMEIKGKALGVVLTKVGADNKITQEDMDLVAQVEKEAKLDAKEAEFMRGEIEKLKMKFANQQ